MEVQENEERAKVEDINVDEDDASKVEHFDGLVMITKECHLASPVCDQPPDEVLAQT